METTQRVTIIRVSLNESASHVEITRVQNLARKQFGRLTVKRFYKKTLRGKYYTYYWECVCSCGQACVITGGNLISGHSKSCGCLKLEPLERWRETTHGMSCTRIYRVWYNMIDRCENLNHAHYKNYGGRGIRVCKRWHKFENFYADMGDKPTPAHSLDRINNGGDYCKSNCRWATSAEQCRNMRVNRLITFRGKTQCLQAWVEETGIDSSTLNNRLSRGWPIKRALLAPVRVKNGYQQ